MTTGKKISWKQNIRKIPEAVSRKLKTIKSRSIIVACTKSIRKSDIVRGVYRHVGIQWNNETDEIVYQERLVPDPKVGSASTVNVEGKEVVRKDLPKVTKTFSWEAPDWGDPSNGYHDVSINRLVYQRDFIHPKNLEIKVELLNTTTIAGEEEFSFKFEIDDVLDSSDEDFLVDLLFALNLLQENVGKCDVFSSDATRVDFLKTVTVDWEILPPGEREETLARILKRLKISTSAERDEIAKRYDLLAKLKPEAFISGTSGFQRYFGAKFRDDLVVFENLRFGNAIYVMYSAWETLSKRTRLDLLKSGGDGFDRIVHRDGWETKLKTLIRQKLDQKTD